MATNYNKSNPAFEGNVTEGSPGEHSSQVKSVAREAHAQSDDAISNIDGSEDPNLSGTAPTRDLHPWRAGGMSAWQENDDYRKFFEAAHVAESATTHRHDRVHDGDYDDNRGIPLAIGHHEGMPGEDNPEAHLRQGTLPAADEFPIGPVVRRRI